MLFSSSYYLSVVENKVRLETGANIHLDEVVHVNLMFLQYYSWRTGYRGFNFFFFCRNSHSTVINSLTRFPPVPFGENSFWEYGPPSPFLVNANTVKRIKELWSSEVSGDCCSLLVSLELRSSQNSLGTTVMLGRSAMNNVNSKSHFELQHIAGLWCLADR